jgi:chromosome segregation ATPase
LTNLNQKQAAARVQVERLQRRNEIISRIEGLKVRIPIAKYRFAKRAHTELKAKRKELQKDTAELMEKIAPLKDRTDNYETRLKQMQRQQELATKALDRIRKTIKQHEDKSSSFDERAGQLRRDKTAIRKASQDRRLKLQKHEEEVEKAQNTLNNCQRKYNDRDENMEKELKVYPFDFSDIGKIPSFGCRKERGRRKG